MLHFVTVALCWLSAVLALKLDTNDKDSIVAALDLIATGVMDYYQGDDYGGTVGMFVNPYYWWEAGGAFGLLIDYSYYTGNDTWVKTIKEALAYQTGHDNNYVPLNQLTTEGNDDQGFWGIAVMGAAEKNFGDPDDPDKAYLTLAQAVFNTMLARWDTTACNGGLRWQIFQWNAGYDYKNAVSNGCFFHIGARLARFTGNQLYVDWAEKIWDWMEEVQLIKDVRGYLFVYDGIHIHNECGKITPLQWSYNQGLFLSGAAYLYNMTGDQKWLNRSTTLLKGAEVFFNKTAWQGSEVMFEAACQGAGNCDQNQRSFKAYFSRFLGLTALMIPEFWDGGQNGKIKKWLVDSANAAAGSCSGGSDGHTCGLDWTRGYWDGVFGLGEQMAALEVMQNLLIHEKAPPYTAENGGTSRGNPAAGFATEKYDAQPLDLGGGDKAGAGIITAVVGISVIGAGVWLLL